MHSRRSLHDLYDISFNYYVDSLVFFCVKYVLTLNI